MPPLPIMRVSLYSAKTWPTSGSSSSAAVAPNTSTGPAPTSAMLPQAARQGSGLDAVEVVRIVAGAVGVVVRVDAGARPVAEPPGDGRVGSRPVRARVAGFGRGERRAGPRVVVVVAAIEANVDRRHDVERRRDRRDL